MSANKAIAAQLPGVIPRAESLRDFSVIGPVWLCVVGAQGTLMMPLIVGNLAARLSLSTAEAGLFASSVMTGASIAAFLQILVIRALSWRLMATGLVTLLCVSYAALAIQPTYWAAVLAMACVGFGIGGVLGLSNAAMAESGHQTRALGLALGLMGCVGSALAWVVSQFAPGVGLWIVLIVVCALGFPAVAALPNYAPAAPAAIVRDPSRPAPGGVALITALLAWGTINFASGGFWPLIERIAAADGHPTSATGHAISLALLCTTVGGFAAMALGKRLGLIGPLLVTGLATAAAVLALVMHPSIQVFTVALCVFGFLWNFGPPFQLPVVTAVDLSGRGMPAAILSMKIFMAIGPFAYGLIAEHMGFGSAGLLAAFSAVLSTTLMVLLVRTRSAPTREPPR